MFRALIYPSSGICDYVVELPQWLYYSWIAVCWSQGAVGLGWYTGCRLKHKCFSRQLGYHHCMVSLYIQKYAVHKTFWTDWCKFSWIYYSHSFVIILIVICTLFKRRYGPVVRQTTEWLKLLFPLFLQPVLACVCLDKNQGIEPEVALFLSEDEYNCKINTINSVAAEQLNLFHTVRLFSLHTGASRNLSGSTVCNQ